MVDGESSVGIIGWGTYIPRYRIRSLDIARLWGFDQSLLKSLNIEEKAVASVDEDSVTMGWYAARSALLRAEVDVGKLGAIFVGTESKPYAVKPSATIIGDALGLPNKKLASDMEFACRAAGEGIRISIGLVVSGMIKYSLVIGSDTAQANPGDVLELTAASGAAAYVIGPKSESVAYFEGSYTFTSDTPDFWRRDGSPYPMHGEVFTDEPAYFNHIVNSVRGLMSELGLRPDDFDYAVFHQPNGRFPLRVGSELGFPRDKILPGLLNPWIGNTYNASALLGLAKVLEESKPGQRILLATFGSGAGSDAFSLLTTDKLLLKVDKALKVSDMLNNKIYVGYDTYSKFRKLLERI
ncbi:MAG: hydroxymethylglutaryl-CoA synthase [Sulfolobales archaeon]